MSEIGTRDWAEVEAYPLPPLVEACLEAVGEGQNLVLRRHIVEQAWEIERLRALNHHLRECLREIAPLVLSADFAEGRYPLAYSECKAL